MARSEPRALVVDDHPGMRITLAGVMEDQGFDVTDVENGYQAIRAARQARYDLIIMDMDMPGMNGIQTYGEIKKIVPAAVVVMMTGYDREDRVRAALDEGVSSVIRKPFDPRMMEGVKSQILDLIERNRVDVLK